MRRLSTATLATLPPGIGRPGYDRRSVATGVVHLGIGAFHRAHQATVFDAALSGGDPRWGIVGVSLRSAGVRDRMAPQDGLYTVVVRDGEAETASVVGAVREVLAMPDDPGRVVAALAAAETHLVTMTVTEKGYRLDRATGGLDRADPDVAADLSGLAAPRTAAGLIVAALARRRTAGIKPFTAISCDNLSGNGRSLSRSVVEMAEAHDVSLARWIEAEGAFPCTMVDRIVPATDDAAIAVFAAASGVEDHALVSTEPFWQWVIEDRFAGPRPDFARLGVQLTSDVAPWETAKLRLLNAAHSAIAYLGGLAGITFVHQAMADPALRRVVELLWDEMQPTLDPPAGFDGNAYRAALTRRFANGTLQHRTRQIAADGSQKLPQRLLAPILWRLERGLAIDASALAVAGWMRWQAGRDELGGRFDVDDPLSAVIADRLRGVSDAAGRVAALLTIGEIFPPILAGDAAFRDRLTDALRSLEVRGARRTIEQFGQRGG